MNDKLSEEASDLPLEMWNFCCSLSNVLKLSWTAWDIFWVVPGVSGGTVVVEGISGKKKDTKCKVGQSSSNKHTKLTPDTLRSSTYTHASLKFSFSYIIKEGTKKRVFLFLYKQRINKKSKRQRIYPLPPPPQKKTPFQKVKVPVTGSRWWKFLRSILTGWGKLKTTIHLCITPSTFLHV